MTVALRPIWWKRTAPLPRTADALLPDAVRFDRNLQVELMRADRSGTTFCLAVFSLGPVDPARPDDEYDFAAYLMSRLRATDHAGCMGERRIAVVLWDTGYDGAKAFAEKVLANFPDRKPSLEVYVYPTSKGDGPTGGDPGGSAPTDPPVNPRPLEELLIRPLPRWKRAIDVAGATAGLIALSPLLAAAAAAIKLTDPGPVLFAQPRSGLGGRTFTIYKFRTMCVDAEAKKAALRNFSEQDGPAFKMAHDPRVTPLGRFLRKSAIDELPQLWNVLIGDMSLVGPRPLPVNEQAGCQDWERRRLLITPGLTCIWQVDGKSRVPFKEWMRMDIRYMNARTLGHDLRLLFRTFAAVVLHRASH